MNSVRGPLKQNDKMEWVFSDGSPTGARKQQDDILRAIRAINQYSRYEHRIMVCIDDDMDADPDWLKENKNAFIYKTKSIVDHPYRRYSATVKESLLSLEDDDELVCYAYIADLICSKDWDYYIMEAYNKHGSDKTYAPMFVEPRVPQNKMYAINGINIWERWRQEVCHALIFPLTPERKQAIDQGKDYIKESDFDGWQRIATAEARFPEMHLEPCGKRLLGYFTALVATAGRLKKRIEGIASESGWDLKFESMLGTKVCCTKSFLLHSHFPYKFNE